MSSPIEMQIADAEERLRLAMLDSDVDALDELLAPELMFTNHLGQVLTKQDDLAAHRTGSVKIDLLAPSERRVRVIGDVAVVSVRVRLVGSYQGNASEADFRFTRVWVPAPAGGWHVVAAHSTIVAV
jgi:ketosteroid isomerase-like protein